MSVEALDYYEELDKHCNETNYEDEVEKCTCIPELDVWDVCGICDEYCEQMEEEEDEFYDDYSFDDEP